MTSRFIGQQCTSPRRHFRNFQGCQSQELRVSISKFNLLSVNIQLSSAFSFTFPLPLTPTSQQLVVRRLYACLWLWSTICSGLRLGKSAATLRSSGLDADQVDQGQKLVIQRLSHREAYPFRDKFVLGCRQMRSRYSLSCCNAGNSVISVPGSHVSYTYGSQGPGP